MQPQPPEIPFPKLLEQFQNDPLSLRNRVPGIWPIHKPSGPSSNLMVVRARKSLGTRRVGHAGTLDPMAEGLLLLLAGNATRLFDELQAFPKTYRAGFELGRRTDSQDATGAPVEWAPRIPPPLSREAVEAALAPFRGDILQTPPMHSALKKGGQPLYRLARRGESVEREPRPVTVYDARLEEFDGAAGVLTMRVSKGFYVRTLVDDLGVALGCGAVMTSLVRTAVGPFLLEDAMAPDAIRVGGE